MRIVQVVGARPQFVKLAAVSRAIAARREAGVDLQETILHTGQHYDAGMSDVFFEELSIPRPALNLDVRSGPHGAQTGRMLESIEQALLATPPDAVVVYGDTNSTLAGALAASKLGIPVAHVEAGLRSFNRHMPEELNRIVTDQLSDQLLAPTATAMTHLAREGLAARSRLVGDVMFDAARYGLSLARERSSIRQRLGLEASTYFVATLHRAENTTAERLGPLLDLLGRVATDHHPVVLPVHPRTRAVLERELPGLHRPPALRLVDPLPYLDMLSLVEGSALVLTDSGGLQKEAYMLGRPCVTLRSETEWPETVEAGANVVAGADPGLTDAAIRRFLAAGPDLELRLRAAATKDYGSGQASERVVDAILELKR